MLSIEARRRPQLLVHNHLACLSVASDSFSRRPQRIENFALTWNNDYEYTIGYQHKDQVAWACALASCRSSLRASGPSTRSSN